jgi:monoamine oxidase
VALLVGNWDMAKDWIDFSNKDYQRSPDTRKRYNFDYLCKEGFGALLAHSGGDISVRLNTRAIKIAPIGGRRVSVETNTGKLTAKSCIVTVSTAVIAQHGIEIVELPAALEQAFADVSLGTYNRTVLEFTEDVFGAPETDWFAFSRVADVNGGRPRGIVFTTNVAGTKLVYGDVGGEFAKELENAGQDALRDFALEEIARMLGNGARRKFTGKSHTTNWSKDPLFLGSFASATPGKASQRQVLKDARIDDLIFFAGEAHHDCEWATVSGAHKSGCQTAQRVLNILYGTSTDLSLCETVEATSGAAPIVRTGKKACFC